MIEHEQERMAAICGMILTDIEGVLYAVELGTDLLRGKTVFVSGYVERLLGYKPSEFIDNPELWFSIIHADDRENVQSISFQIQTSKQPQIRVYRVRHKNSGKYLWMEDRVTPQIDEHGTFKGFLGIATDITKRKEAQARDTRELTYESIVESIPDAILVVNSRGIIVNANLQAETMFGYSLTELMNKTIESLMPESSREKHVRHRDGYSSHAYPRLMGAGLELRVRRKDGTEFPADIALAPVRTDGTLLVVCTIRDITDWKKAEDRLNISNDRLRLLAAKIETCLEDERILIARNIHDDLGQQLTGLRLDVAAVERTLLQTKGEHLPTTLIDSIKSISAQLELSILGVQHFAAYLRPDTLQRLRLVESMRSYVAEFITRTQIPCKLDIVPRRFQLDPERSMVVLRIFQESLMNVARHARASKVEIILRKKRDTVELSIKDDGRGIRDAEVSDSRSLGLIGMRERALQFGGKMEIRGMEGGGTSIIVHIPCTRADRS